MNHSANTLPPELDAAPPKLTARSGNSLALALGLLVMMVACAALFFFNPAEHAFYPQCYFHQLTGLQCPGCGGLRAVHQVLHGHWLTALHLNGLAVLSLPVFAGFLWREFTGGRRGIGGWWIWSYLAIMVVFTVLRNLPAFAFLSP